MKNDHVWREVFWTWFVTAMMFYGFGLLPLVIFCMKYFVGHPILQSYSWDDWKWLWPASVLSALAVVSASVVGWLMAYLAEEKVRNPGSTIPYSRSRQILPDPRARMKIAQRYIARGKKLRPRTNLFSLAYASLAFIGKWFWILCIALISHDKHE
ncbi:MAG: hypothetical protein ACYC75_02265 [Minisyncoccota bacterium]